MTELKCMQIHFTINVNISFQSQKVIKSEENFIRCLLHRQKKNQKIYIIMLTDSAEFHIIHAFISVCLQHFRSRFLPIITNNSFFTLFFIRFYIWISNSRGNTTFFFFKLSGKSDLCRYVFIIKTD